MSLLRPLLLRQLQLRLGALPSPLPLRLQLRFPLRRTSPCTLRRRARWPLPGSVDLGLVSAMGSAAACWLRCRVPPRSSRASGRAASAEGEVAVLPLQLLASQQVLEPPLALLLVLLAAAARLTLSGPIPSAWERAARLEAAPAGLLQLQRRRQLLSSQQPLRAILTPPARRPGQAQQGFQVATTAWMMMIQTQALVRLLAAAEVPGLRLRRPLALEAQPAALATAVALPLEQLLQQPQQLSLPLQNAQLPRRVQRLLRRRLRRELPLQQRVLALHLLLQHWRWLQRLQLRQHWYPVFQQTTQRSRRQLRSLAPLHMRTCRACGRCRLICPSAA